MKSDKLFFYSSLQPPDSVMDQRLGINAEYWESGGTSNQSGGFAEPSPSDDGKSGGSGAGQAAGPATGLPLGIPGYIDVNLGYVIGGGVQIGDGPPGPFGGAPSVHDYYGLQSPNASITWAPTGTISPGLNLGAGVSVPIPIGDVIVIPVMFQFGNSSGGWFWEVGVGWPPGIGFGGWGVR